MDTVDININISKKIISKHTLKNNITIKLKEQRIWAKLFHILIFSCLALVDREKQLGD